MHVASSSESEYLTFCVNDSLFAIKSSYIDSISSLQDVTKLPKTDKTIDGTIIYRNSTIIVINLSEYLFNQSEDEDELNQCVICKIGDKTIALRISKAHNILRVNDSEIFEKNSMIKTFCTMLSGFIADSNKNIIGILDIDYIIKHYESATAN